MKQYKGTALPAGKACKILGVSQSKLRQLALAGEIQFHVVSERGDRRYPIEAVDAFMNSGGVKGRR